MPSNISDESCAVSTTRRFRSDVLCLHVIRSFLADGRSQLELDHSLPAKDAGGFHITRWNLALLRLRLMLKGG
jgi:hypothetical protein